MNQLNQKLLLVPFLLLALLILGLLYFQMDQMGQAAQWHLEVLEIQCHLLDPLVLKVLAVQDFQQAPHHQLNLVVLEVPVVLGGLADQVHQLVQAVLYPLSDQLFLVDQKVHLHLLNR